jgi:hypothetical protein
MGDFAMKRTKKKILRAAVVGAVGAAIAVPVIASTASAQTNFRLCGHYWRSDVTGEVVTRLYKVEKEDDLGAICPRSNGPGPKGSPFAADLKDKDFKNSWQQHDSIYEVVCEEWKTRDTGLGGLGGKALNFIGSKWPEYKDQYDICKDMKASAPKRHQYWLYYNGDPASPKVDFERD